MSRVTDVRYVGYAVTDLAAERAFYRDVWKLKEVREADGLVYFAAEGDDTLYVVRLRQSAEKRIDVVALAADSNADVDALHAAVVASGCKVIFAPQDLTTYGGGYGFRFFNPDGIEMEVSAGVARGTARVLEPREAVPAKISHVCSIRRSTRKSPSGSSMCWASGCLTGSVIS